MENSREAIREEKVENKEDINDIRKKIRESLGEKRIFNSLESGDFKKEKNILEKGTDPEEGYSKGCKVDNYYKLKRYGSREKERLVKEISKELEDNHSLGAFRTIVDKIPEQQIRIFFSIIKDSHLTGKIKKNKSSMFVSLAKAYTRKNNVDLNFK